MQSAEARSGPFAIGNTSYTAFGDSITCGYVAAGATTGTPYSINDASCHTSNAYPSYIAAATSLPLENYGIPGDQACDIFVRQIAPQSVSPSSANLPLYTVLIGTNDANAKGSGAYESVFTTCSLANLAWLAIPIESKALALSAVNNGWTIGTTSTLGTYASTTTPGATLTFTLTTTGGPLYLWHAINYGTPGAATYSVDGKVLGTFYTSVSVPIVTQNGTLNAVAAERIAGVAAGTHQIVVTCVSGALITLGVGTPAPPTMQTPVVLAGNVPLPSSAATAALLAAEDAYSADMSALITELEGDGLPVIYAPNHAYMQGSAAEMTDLFHVSPLGAQHLADAFLAVAP